MSKNPQQEPAEPKFKLKITTNNPKTPTIKGIAKPPSSRNPNIQDLNHHLSDNKKSLNLSNHSIAQDILRKELGFLNNVENMNLSHCKTINPLDQTTLDISNRDLQSLTKLTKLKHLDISGCSELGNGVLVYLQNTTSLETLNVSGTKIDENGIKALKAKNPNLTIINDAENKEAPDLVAATANLTLQSPEESENKTPVTVHVEQAPNPSTTAATSTISLTSTQSTQQI